APSLAEHLRQVQKEKWRVSNAAVAEWELTQDDVAQLTLRLPAIQDESLHARLSDDGKTLQLTGTTCKKSELANVALPFGRATSDDLELHVNEDRELTIRASKRKTDANVKITKVSMSSEPESIKDLPKPQEEEEKELNEKFNVAREVDESRDKSKSDDRQDPSQHE
ncbi:MAG: hypothetical protein SGPRY_004240, partial [Prymnesium sp.]